jgi:hypothetical protein
VSCNYEIYDQEDLHYLTCPYKPHMKFLSHFLAIFLITSCNDHKPNSGADPLAATLIDIPVPWDTVQWPIALEESGWRRLSLTPAEHCYLFRRTRAPGRSGRFHPMAEFHGLEWEPRFCHDEYLRSKFHWPGPSLFFERISEDKTLGCILVLEYSRYAEGLLPERPSYWSPTPPRISLKLFHKDSIIEGVIPPEHELAPFDKGSFIQLYKRLDRSLQKLTGDKYPSEIMPKLKNSPRLPPRDYRHMVGYKEYESGNSCIQAKLKLLPAKPPIEYRREAYGAWLWNDDTGEYEDDRSLYNDKAFKPRFGRSRQVSDFVIYDIHWEDLAIYVEIVLNRYEGQYHGHGDTTGVQPCPRLSTLKLPVK